MFFITKTVTTDLFILKKNTKREPFAYPAIIKPVCWKRTLGFDNKENYDTEKLLSCIPTTFMKCIAPMKISGTTQR